MLVGESTCHECGAKYEAENDNNNKKTNQKKYCWESGLNPKVGYMI